MRLDPKQVVAVSAALALAACARDLDLPAANGGPRVASFTPASAYAGEQLVITGSGFDSDPLGNLVQFTRASARAEAASGGSIVVRVPAEAGDGPFTVTTKGGVSAPAAQAFGYLGRGELSTLAVASEIPTLHKPYRVLPARDETFLHSDLLLGILRYGDPSYVDAYGVYLDQARWTTPDPSVVWLEADAGYPASALVRETVSPSGVTTLAAASGLIPYTLGPIAVMQAAGGRPDLVAVFSHEGANPRYTVTLRRLDTFAPVYAGSMTVTGVSDLRNCVDAGGDLACLGRATGKTQSDPLTLFRIRFTATPTATATFPTASTPAALVESRFLPEDPLCADTTSHRAVAALTDGRLASLDVSALPGAALTLAATGSRTPARSLTCVPGATGYGTATGPTVLVSKLGDDLLGRLDPVTGTIRWTAAVPGASYAGLWCSDAPCSAAGATVHAAGEADNSVRLLDLATGALLARRAMDVGAGRVDAPNKLIDLTANQGAAWYQPDQTPYLAFLTTSPPGVIEWPLTAQRAFGLFPHYLAYSDAVAVVPWAARPGEIPQGFAAIRKNRFAYSNDHGSWSPAFAGTALLAADNVPSDPQVSDASHLHVGTTSGLETIDWYATVSTVAQNKFPPALWMSLTRLPDGHALGALAIGATWWVAAWTEAEAAAGQFPALQWSSPGSIEVAAARLDGQLWAFYWDNSYASLHAVALTDQLVTVPGSDVVLADPFYSILAVSPNGRSFVSWDYQSFSRNTSAVIWAPDGTGSFVRRATIPVEGQISGATFDLSGETLYLVTRGPDRIVVVQ